MLVNSVLQIFHDGGSIMWPLLATLILALMVILDRTLWWFSHSARLDAKARSRARDFLGRGDFADAHQLGKSHRDVFLIALAKGLENAHTSLLAAMQLEAEHELERAEARQWILGTIITLAPLLGLMGTVTGIMQSFDFVGDEALAATKVSGGIAEALIATAAGLGIAILCLLPYNYFRRRVQTLRAHLERWINHSELLIQSAGTHGHDVNAFAETVHPKPAE